MRNGTRRTKWEILAERLEAKKRAFEDALSEQTSLIGTPFKDGDSSCSTCGAVLATEADFAKHYLIDDERYPNLGNCPTRYNNGVLMPSLSNSWGYSLHEVALQENKVYNEWSDNALEPTVDHREEM